MPSNSQSIRRRWSSTSSARRSSIASEPAPETDWYVETRTPRNPAASWSGASTIVSGIVQQFGLAMIPCVLEGSLAIHLRHDERNAVLRAGMPRTCRCRRAPASAAIGTSSRLIVVPIENKQTSRSPAPRTASVASSTTKSPSRPPAERHDANVADVGVPTIDQIPECHAPDGTGCAHDTDAELRVDHRAPV